MPASFPEPASDAKQHGLVLGYDFGTSSVKAALMDRAGALVACARADYPLHLPAPGHAEQNPADWWQALSSVTRELLTRIPDARDRVAGLGIAAQMAGVIPVDGAGAPLHPCLTWMDTRSAGVARAITAGGPRVAGYGAFKLAAWLWLANGAPNLSGKDPLSKILWFRAARPDLWREAARFLDVKDWLVHRLTGRFTTTPDLAQLTWMMDNRVGRRQWSEPWLRRMGVARERLPEIVASGDVAGRLTAQAAAALGLPAGLPVSGGCGDVNACALAAGDHHEGVYHLHLGTSMWLGAHTRRRRVDPFTGIATICAAQPDRYFLVATQESAGGAAQWAAETFGFGAGAAGLRALDAAAAQARPAADAPYFLPWLYGERVPVDDPHLRGALAGLSLRNGRADLARAVLEGVALNVRWAMHHAERLLPAVPAPLRLMGGGAASAAWAQILADTLQRPVQAAENPAWAGARGAAMTAAAACGDLPDYAAATLAHWGPVIEPDPAQRSRAQARFQRFVAYWRATRRWSRP
ncbi:MAG: xylulose kinase [Betaproteobacteria bacterium]|nr:xylulose kinase [Betaproteobacteria bacterium]